MHTILCNQHDRLNTSQVSSLVSVRSDVCLKERWWIKWENGFEGHFKRYCSLPVRSSSDRNQCQNANQFLWILSVFTWKPVPLISMGWASKPACPLELQTLSTVHKSLDSNLKRALDAVRSIRILCWNDSLAAIQCTVTWQQSPLKTTDPHPGSTWRTLGRRNAELSRLPQLLVPPRVTPLAMNPWKFHPAFQIKQPSFIRWKEPKKCHCHMLWNARCRGSFLGLLDDWNCY